MNFTIGYTTSRHTPELEWFLDSIKNGLDSGVISDQPEIIVVNLHQFKTERRKWKGINYLLTPIKPTVWQGDQRLPKDHWWAVSNARNTALCLAKSPYIFWLDDRCALSDTWLHAAMDAARGMYCVCGKYQKRHGMVVQDGEIVTEGTITGEDHRKDFTKDRPIKAPGSWYYGGTLGMPTELALAVNGFDELMDGMGMEDCMMGLHLEANKSRIFYDPRLYVIQDRTPQHSGPVMKRSSKEKHPNDKSDKAHTAINRFGYDKMASHHWHIPAIRDEVLSGKRFPDATQPTHDWFDNQPISEM